MVAPVSPPLLEINEAEISITAIRAQGAGGQNVNKVSSAIHLRFNIAASSLPDDVKGRLLDLHDSRITKDGVLVVKAMQHRTQEMNRLDAFSRLHELVNSVAVPPRTRHATKPSYASRQRLRVVKTQRSEIKALRARPASHDT